MLTIDGLSKENTYPIAKNNTHTSSSKWCSIHDSKITKYTQIKAPIVEMIIWKKIAPSQKKKDN